MCGLIGYWGDSLPDESVRSSSLERIAYRGPDSQAQLLDTESGLWLGHCRLAIIDPEKGHQPMTSADGSTSIVFNGCIYNYAGLRQHLRSLGHCFRTDSDTEVILQAYIEYGVECLEHLRGMFAFAIWDRRCRRLLLARDPLGIKPLYYAADAHGLSFASEIKALKRLGLPSRSLDRAALSDHIHFQAYTGDETLLAGVKRLLPGHYAVAESRGRITRIEKYWDLTYEIDPGRPEVDFVDQARWQLMDAVTSHLRSDVPLGFHLSGGLDSSSVVCLAAQSSQLVSAPPSSTVKRASD